MLKTKEKDCCGCTICAEACPRHIIHILFDEQGCAFSAVKDRSQCINCNICNHVCPVQRTADLNKHIETVFAVKSKKNRELSQSGGAFAVIAEYIIEEYSGVVYGAVLDGENDKVAYQRAEHVNQLEKMKGSKYVQAYMENVVHFLIRDLQKGRKVFFCGSPCYVYGVKLLAKQFSLEHNLITADFICHGVAVPSMFRKYMRYIRDRFGKASDFNFRDKTVTGWRGHIESFVAGKEKIVSKNYANMYYSHILMRSSCYQCKFTNQDRVGDITIGDFWGIEKSAKKFADNKGISFFAINSERGANVWEDIKGKFDYIPENIENGLQPTIQHPIEKPECYSGFWEVFTSKGFVPAVVKYCGFDEENFVSIRAYRVHQSIGNFKSLIYRILTFDLKG